MRGRGKKENLWTFYKKERDESLRESKQLSETFLTRKRRRRNSIAVYFL